MQYINTMSANGSARSILHYEPHPGQHISYKGESGRAAGRGKDGWFYIIWMKDCIDAIDASKKLKEVREQLRNGDL